MTGSSLDAAAAITEKSCDPRREVELPGGGQNEGPGQAVEALYAEIAELRASRARLVRAADEDRRRIERELHGGVQQHLVALAVRLQLLKSALDSDPAAVRALLEELGRDAQQAVDEAAGLAQRIYAPLPELGGLGALLRSAAVSAGVRASVDVSSATAYPPEIVQTIYACWLDALEQAGNKPVAVTVREEAGGVLAFEVVRDDGGPLDELRDRVEALGGRLAVGSEPGGGVRVSGTLPLSR